MATMTMSIPALYKFALDVDNIDIFSGLSVPALVDRSALIDYILFKSAPFECLYPNPEYMQSAISTWSTVHARTFNKWAEALNIAYDPLFNYDRTEVESDNAVNSEIHKHTGNADETTTGSNNTDTTTGTKRSESTIGSTKDATSNNATNNESVSAYNSLGWSDTNKNVNNASTNATANTLTSSNGNGTTDESVYNDHVDTRESHDKASEKRDVLNSRSRKLRAFGNIGVVSSQKMLSDELEIDAWNIYDHITDLFLDEFCVLLY